MVRRLERMKVGLKDSMLEVLTGHQFGQIQWGMMMEPRLVQLTEKVWEL
jgi:hypothetical protein